VKVPLLGLLCAIAIAAAAEEVEWLQDGEYRTAVIEGHGRKASKTFTEASAVKIVDNGLDENRIVWVFIGEGYLESEQDQYASDVVSNLADMMQYEPWRSYASCINVYMMTPCISNEHMGIDAPSDSLFRLYFYYGPISTLIWNNTVHYEAPDFVDAFGPGRYESIFIICNDMTRVGGAAYRNLAIFNLYGGGTYIAVHELGHQFGHLSDEYVHWPYCLPTAGMSTVNTQYIPDAEIGSVTEDDVIWSHWIEDGADLPGAGSNGVGLFLGSHYCGTEHYRPSYHCMMRGPASGYCKICMEALIVSIYDYVDPIDDVNYEGYVSAEADILLSVDLIDVGSLRIAWLIDDATVAFDTSTCIIRSASCVDASKVTLKVWDETPMVRIDPYISPLLDVDYHHHDPMENKISSEREWAITNASSVSSWGYYE
jgi:hypothetical protein